MAILSGILIRHPGIVSLSMLVIRASLEGSGLFWVARVLQRSAELPWPTRAELSPEFAVLEQFSP